MGQDRGQRGSGGRWGALGVRVWLSLIGLGALVVVGSSVSEKLWAGGTEVVPTSRTLVLRPDITVAEFGRENALAHPMLRDVFGLHSPADLEQRLSNLSLTEGEIRARVGRSVALEAEGASKNWQKILVKFGLWFGFLGEAPPFLPAPQIWWGTATRWQLGL